MAKKPNAWVYEDVNELCDDHIDDLDATFKSDMRQMVDAAMMTVVFILYAGNDGDIEDAISDLYAATRKAVKTMDDPRFGSPH